ncbi:pilus assembly PilX N-terminal domain-containing protein [Candidatus Woesebacteria bacterium]|nr:pilus assembly PilX N-terminal domain-containing protein [Candidatus Woesebacteria bacterium]
MFFTSGKTQRQRSTTLVSGQPGQVAVVVLLIMAVMLVVVYSLATRTTEEINLSGQEQDSTRVFNAAETGVEQALSESKNYFATVDANGSATGAVDSSQLPANTSATFSITAQTGLITKIVQGSTATVFVEPTSTSMTIYWSASTQACNAKASLIFAIYYDTNKVAYEAVKPNCVGYDAAKATGFNKDMVSAGSWASGNGLTLQQRYILQLPTATYPNHTMVRITAVYADADISISGVDSQAYEIKSEATSISDGASAERSAIKVVRTRPAPPQVFGYSVYSGGSLAK